LPFAGANGLRTTSGLDFRVLWQRTTSATESDLQLLARDSKNQSWYDFLGLEIANEKEESRRSDHAPEGCAVPRSCVEIDRPGCTAAGR
jgi:hypothetical protein